jgi:hypothetical protein
MNKLSLWIRIPVTAFVISALAALVVTAIGLIGKWNTVDYSNGMFLGGAVAIAFALLSSFGGWKNRADFKQVYSQSAGDMSIAERSRLWVQDMTRGYNAFLLMSMVGILLIGLSILIGSSLD